MVSRSLLNKRYVDINPQIRLYIPTVGEVLDNEGIYFSLISVLTSSPFQYMVQLDDLGIDFTKITDYQMFLLFFPSVAQSDISIIFGDLYTQDFIVKPNNQNDTYVLYSPSQNITIDELAYRQIASVLRQVNQLKRNRDKPGTESSKEYLLEKERRHMRNMERRRKNQEYVQSEFEKLVVALVNQKDFKYNYEEVKGLSIYNFYQSFKQIQHNIDFTNVMRGVYAGTIDTSKITNKDCLFWIPKK